MENTELEAARADRKRAADKRTAALAVGRQTETPNVLEEYDLALERTRYDAGTLAASIAELRAAAAATGRINPPGFNLALGLERAVLQTVRGWERERTPRVDPVAERIRAAVATLEHQQKCLAWAQALPREHTGRAHAINLYSEGVKAAQRELARAKGEPDPTDSVSFSERLDALTARLGIRAARQELGLSVDSLPEVGPLPTR
jgi:hypothetical protein